MGSEAGPGNSAEQPLAEAPAPEGESFGFAEPGQVRRTGRRGLLGWRGSHGRRGGRHSASASPDIDLTRSGEPPPRRGAPPAGDWDAGGGNEEGPHYLSDTYAHPAGDVGYYPYEGSEDGPETATWSFDSDGWHDAEADYPAEQQWEYTEADRDESDNWYGSGSGWEGGDALAGGGAWDAGAAADAQFWYDERYPGADYGDDRLGQTAYPEAGYYEQIDDQAYDEEPYAYDAYAPDGEGPAADNQGLFLPHLYAAEGYAEDSSHAIAPSLGAGPVADRPAEGPHAEVPLAWPFLAEPSLDEAALAPVAEAPLAEAPLAEAPEEEAGTEEVEAGVADVGFPPDEIAVAEDAANGGAAVGLSAREDPGAPGVLAAAAEGDVAEAPAEEVPAAENSAVAIAPPWLGLEELALVPPHLAPTSEPSLETGPLHRPRQEALAAYQDNSASHELSQIRERQTRQLVIAPPARTSGPWPELVMVAAVAVVIAAVILTLTTTQRASNKLTGTNSTSPPTVATTLANPQVRPKPKASGAKGAKRGTRTKPAHKPATTTTTPAPAINLAASAGVRQSLVVSWLATNPGGVGLGPADIAGTVPDSVYYGEVTKSHVYWAIAEFQASKQLLAQRSTAAGQAALAQFQDTDYVFSGNGGSTWTELGYVNAGGCPGQYVPNAVLAIWGLCGFGSG
ncbi:MAG TPA: hypothetical protein VME46_26400 [Acidimicrobiales bacterium]|nr:hypothetical protein [Acidimicrobiales bacterium]